MKRFFEKSFMGFHFAGHGGFDSEQERCFWFSKIVTAKLRK